MTIPAIAPPPKPVFEEVLADVPESVLDVVRAADEVEVVVKVELELGVVLGVDDGTALSVVVVVEVYKMFSYVIRVLLSRPPSLRAATH